MLNRRRFLKGLSTAAAGAVVGSSLTGYGFAMRNQQESVTPAHKRREIRIGGRRVRTIDTWNHVDGPNFAFPDIWKVIPKDQKVPASLEREAQKYRSQPVPDFDPHGPYVQKRLADMDGMGIDVAVVCVGFNYWAERSLSREITQIQNEKLSELSAAYPDRFAGFGMLSMQYPDLAVEEMEKGAKLPGIVGFSVSAPDGNELSDPKFHAVWAKAEQLGTVIDLHGGGGGISQTRFKGHGMLGSVIVGAVGVTLALTKLIEEGTLDLFPDLKVLAQRGGGYIINDDAFGDRCQEYFPTNCLPQAKKHPQEYYLKRLYYNSVHQTSEDLRHLIAVVGASQVVLGTDNQGQTREVGGDFDTTTTGSLGWNPDAVNRVLAVPGLSNEGKAAILGGNAARLLRIRS